MENSFKAILQISNFTVYHFYLGGIPTSSFIADFPKISNRSHEESEIEYEGYDGWYNNRAHPDWGGVGRFIYASFNFLAFSILKGANFPSVLSM